MRWQNTEEQAHLSSMLRSFFDREWHLDRLREGLDGTADPTRAWRRLAELGVQGALVPEAYGGLGWTLTDVTVIMSEMGRALFPSPFLPTSVLAVTALLSSGDEEACRTVLPAVAEGTRRVTLTPTPDGGAGLEEVTAAPAGSSWQVHGSSKLVLDAHDADLVLVLASADGDASPSLFAVDVSTSDRVTVTARASMDASRPLADMQFHATPARLLGQRGRGQACADEAFAAGLVALSAEHVGVAERCVELAVEYAKVREQFDRPIGSFQAVQHRCAQMLVQVEAGWTATRAAADVALAGGGDRLSRARVAKIVAGEAMAFSAAENVHLHGANGFSWEYDEHLYYRRARASELLLGSPDFHRRALARSLGLAALDKGHP